MHSYAIGDIHGHLALLQGVHALIAKDIARHGAGPVVHVGDLVDRGPDSRGVIDFLIAGLNGGQDWIVLKGNHDRMFSLFMADPKAQDEGLRAEFSWLHPRLGGATTLQSYGVRSAADRPVAAVHSDAVASVPLEHISFLSTLPTSHRVGGVIFVHAGLRPMVPLADQLETDLLWIRAPFLDHAAPHEALIVHGHTAIEAATHCGNRVNIDSSAAYGGPLSVVVIEEDLRVFALTPEGRVPLLP